MRPICSVTCNVLNIYKQVEMSLPPQRVRAKESKAMQWFRAFSSVCLSSTPNEWQMLWGREWTAVRSFQMASEKEREERKMRNPPTRLHAYTKSPRFLCWYLIAAISRWLRAGQAAKHSVFRDKIDRRKGSGSNCADIRKVLAAVELSTGTAPQGPC